MIRTTLVLPSLLSLCFAASAPAHAQGGPAKPVRLVLSQPPGSSPDIVARLVADRLTRQWGQAVEVENRPGAELDSQLESMAAALNAQEEPKCD